jgi:hypothetical protein
MIHKLYVIHLSGICIYYLDFASIQLDKKEFDPQLLSGFFTAIMEFANSATAGNYMTEGSRTIDMLCLKNRNYYISKNHNFYYIMESDQADQNITKEDVEKLLDFVEQRFKRKTQEGISASITSEMLVDEELGSSIKQEVSRIMRMKLLHKG